MFQFRFLLLLAVISGVIFTFVACSGQSKQTHIARGEEYLQKNKYQEAVMEFRAAADIDKTSADAHWGLARAYENLGQSYEAIQELRLVAEWNPDNLEAKARLGNYLLLGQSPAIEEVEKILQDILTRNPNFVEGYILKASLLTAQKKPEKDILDALNYAVSLNPNHVESYVSLSRFLMKINKRTEAEQTIQKAISVNPNAALGYVEYGRLLTFTDRAAQAEAQFQKAIEVEPKNVEAREAIAEFYLAQRQLDKAEQSYKSLVEVQENSPESRIKLGNFYTRIERPEDAIQVFTGIVAEQPEYARARYRLGEIYLERKEDPKALEQVEALLKLNDNDVQALLLRARIRMQASETEKAVQDLEEVLKKQPSQRDALFYMATARLALGQIDQARAFIGDLEKYHPNFLKARLLKIQASFAVGESDNALRQANELLDVIKKTFPNADTSSQGLEDLKVRALTARGMAFLELGKVAEAKADLQSVLTISPNSSAAMVNLAKAAIAGNNLSEAVGLYEKAAADGKNFDALSGLVNALTRQKQFDRAHQEINRAIEASGERKENLPALHYLNATVFTAQKNSESAEAELRKSFEMDETYLPAYSAYAALLIARNQTNEAVEQYKKIVEKKPSASIYTLIGMLEDARNNAAEAEANYRRALELAPETPIAANNLAWLLASHQGNLDEALTLAQTTVNKNQSVAGYYDTLGWVYYKKGLYSPAVEQMKKAVALDKAEASKSGNQPNADYRQRLGMALASAGDKS